VVDVAAIMVLAAGCHVAVAGCVAEECVAEDMWGKTILHCSFANTIMYLVTSETYFGEIFCY
jgi:hypothetical protein